MGEGSGGRGLSYEAQVRDLLGKSDTLKYRCSHGGMSLRMLPLQNLLGSSEWQGSFFIYPVELGRLERASCEDAETESSHDPRTLWLEGGLSKEGSPTEVPGGSPTMPTL